MRAPQYRTMGKAIGKSRNEGRFVSDTKGASCRTMPVGPNPAIAKGLRVEPWANIFALVDGLGVIMPYQTEAEAKAALEAELERRRKLRVVVHDDADNAPKGDQGGGAE
jgi:hypothetical protein